MNWSAALVALARPWAVTITSTVVRATPAGLVTEQMVSLEQVTPVASFAPNLTVFPPGVLSKPVPMMTTGVPPVEGPVAG